MCACYSFAAVASREAFIGRSEIKVLYCNKSLRYYKQVDTLYYLCKQLRNLIHVNSACLLQCAFFCEYHMIACSFCIYLFFHYLAWNCHERIRKETEIEISLFDETCPQQHRFFILGEKINVVIKNILIIRIVKASS